MHSSRASSCNRGLTVFSVTGTYVCVYGCVRMCRGELRKALMCLALTNGRATYRLCHPPSGSVILQLQDQWHHLSSLLLHARGDQVLPTTCPLWTILCGPQDILMTRI